MGDYVIKGVLTGLTPSEKAYLATHPHHISIIKGHADRALAEARRLFKGPGLHNGPGDAFRHCYWSALLARDIGGGNALTFTTAHEGYSANPGDERAMDLHNNLIGINIGQMFPTASDADLSLSCKAALDKGRLMTAPAAVGKPYE